MKRTRLKTTQPPPEDDLSFLPPLAEHAQYIELANEFLAEDPGMPWHQSDRQARDSHHRARATLIDDAA